MRIWTAYTRDRCALVCNRQTRAMHPLKITRVYLMRKTSIDWTVLLAFLAALGVVYGAGIAPASAATISRSVDVKASVLAVWSLIGPFCAIKDWLPPVGQCIEDGKTPSTRI